MYEDTVEPKLVESGVEYFFKEKLKHCHIKRTSYSNTVINLTIGAIFLVGMFLFFYINKKVSRKKITNEERAQFYALMRAKIKNIHSEDSDLIGDHKHNHTLTNLPPFENIDFINTIQDSYMKTKLSSIPQIHN
jgi:hypothetical protein